MRLLFLWMLAFFLGRGLLAEQASSQEEQLRVVSQYLIPRLERKGQSFLAKSEVVRIPEGYADPRVHFAADGGLELIFSFGGEEPRTELWRWEGGRATLVANIPGIVAHEIHELPKCRAGRRLLLEGDNPSLGLSEDLFILMGPSFYHVVELPSDGPPRTVWRSEDLVAMRPESQPAISIDPEGKRWAAALASLRPSKGAVSATVHIGELPETTPSLEFQWIPSEVPVMGETANCFKSEFVRFLGKNRLVLVAGGFPLLLERVGNELRPIILEVPSLPVVETAFFHEPSGILLLESDVGPGDRYGFLLPPEGSVPEGDRLVPTFQLRREDPWLGTIVGTTPEGFVFLDDRSQFEKKVTLVFARVKDQGALEVEKKLVFHRPCKGYPLVDISPDGRTMVQRIPKDGCESEALVRIDLSSIISR